MSRRLAGTQLLLGCYYWEWPEPYSSSVRFAVKNNVRMKEQMLIYRKGMDLAPKPYYWPDIMYGGSPPLATRSGWLALACMPFVFATASKTNWITLVTGVTHERLQVFHRWISYAFFILALLHTFPFIVYHIHWHDMEAHFSSSLLFYWTGIVALICQAWLTFMSHSAIRYVVANL